MPDERNYTPADLRWTPYKRIHGAIHRYHVGQWMTGGRTVAFLTKRRALRAAATHDDLHVAHLTFRCRTGMRLPRGIAAATTLISEG